MDGCFLRTKYSGECSTGKGGSNQSVDKITFIFLIRCQKCDCLNKGDILWHVACEGKKSSTIIFIPTARKTETSVLIIPLTELY